MDWWNVLLFMVPVCLLVGVFVVFDKALGVLAGVLAGVMGRLGVREKLAKVAALIFVMVVCVGIIFATNAHRQAREEAKKLQERPAALLAAPVVAPVQVVEKKAADMTVGSDCSCNAGYRCGGESGWWYCVDEAGKKKFKNQP